MIMGALRLAALCVQLEEQLAVDTGRPIPSALMTSIEQESADVREALAAERLGDER
jgi:hypothetical protein